MDYEGFGIKCIGQSHLENNTVCQDNVQYIQSLKYTVAAVSDGHGGQRYFRSDIGSEYAALIGCEKLSEFLLKSNYLFLDAKGKTTAIDQLIDSIVTEWNISVKEHIAHFPFKDSELSLVDPKDIDEYKKITASQPNNMKPQEQYSSIFKAYGATLICIGMDIQKFNSVLRSIDICEARPLFDINFTLSNSQEARDEALRDAAINAHREAELITEAAGAHLGDLLKIDLTDNCYSFRSMGVNSVSTASSASLSIDTTGTMQPDNITVEVSAEFIWEIK